MRNADTTSSRAGALAPALAAAALALAVAAPGEARAQSAAAGGAAVAAQEAGVIFSDQRIRDMADRRLRLEAIAQRIEEIQLLQQLETIDPAGAREFRAQVFGSTAAASDEFFEEYDKARRERGVVLPVLLAVQGSGGDLVAQVQYDGVTSFVRAGQVMDEDLRVLAVEASAIVVELRGRRFRVPIGG